MINHEMSVAPISSDFLSEEEKERLALRLWELLRWQVESFNGDSTSVKTETAEELLRSLLFTISAVSDYDDIPMNVIFQEDLKSVITRGREILASKLKLKSAEWKQVLKTTPRVKNAYYFDTLKNITLFFKRYDIYFAAHEIPCSIDYPLLRPISEQLTGINYITEYIERTKTENDFLNCFDADILTRLYKSSIPDCEETLFNLCEPALTNAVGLSLVGADIRPLDITERQRKELISLLCGKDTDETIKLIDSAVESVCADLNITERKTAEYLKSAARELCPRIKQAVRFESLSHVFISLLPDGIFAAGFGKYR